MYEYDIISTDKTVLRRCGMKKQKVRQLPYRVYKKMFSDCKAYDYNNGKITVELPDDYLKSKMYIPDGWRTMDGANWVRTGFTDKYGYSVSAEIVWHSDGGCKYYDVYATRGNVFCGGSQKERQYIRSFNKALETANELLAGFNY